MVCFGIFHALHEKTGQNNEKKIQSAYLILVINQLDAQNLVL